MPDVGSLNADLSEHIVIDTNLMDWQASPIPNVWRKRLYDPGPEEAGIVTSVKRYQPGSNFASHPHPGGEEILLLMGFFRIRQGIIPTVALF